MYTAVLSSSGSLFHFSSILVFPLLVSTFSCLSPSFLISSLLLSHLSLFPFSPALVSCFPSSIYLFSHPCMLRSFVYTVVSLLSSSPPCLLSYHASLLCLFLRFHFVYSPLPINMYICTYMHAHIHVNAYIGSGRSMACKDRSSDRSSNR